jgi:hypothetical protein
MLRIVCTLITFANAQPPSGAEPATPPTPPPPAVVTGDEPPENPSTPMISTTGDAFGETGPNGMFSFRTLVQVRYGGTWASEAHEDPLMPGMPEGGAAAAKDGDGWRLNRMFLRMVARPSPRVSVRVLLDFSELLRKNQRRTIKLAYGELKPFKWLEITAGLFKRTFSLLELLPIADYELADVGPTDEFIKDIGYGGRDVGAMVRLSPLPRKRWLSLYLGSFAGDPELGYDASPAKLLTARLESTPWKLPLAYLRLGADVAWRPTTTIDRPKDYLYAETISIDKGAAVSGDMTFHFLGLELRLEGMYGDRPDFLWRANEPVAWNAQLMQPPAPLPARKQFVALWGIAAFRIPIDKYALMPALRAEWLDTDAAHDGEGRLYLTAGLNFEFSESVRLLVDVSHYSVASAARALDDRPWAVPNPNAKGNNPNFLDYRPLDVDWTRLIVQLQLKI